MTRFVRVQMVVCQGFVLSAGTESRTSATASRTVRTVKTPRHLKVNAQVKWRSLWGPKAMQELYIKTMINLINIPTYPKPSGKYSDHLKSVVSFKVRGLVAWSVVNAQPPLMGRQLQRTRQEHNLHLTQQC